MAYLPADHLVPGASLSNVGVDVFGPWLVVVRRTTGGQANNKRWAVIFTSLVIRAIHIEVVDDMGASAFTNALRRFIAIRGKVSETCSDCGNHFIGATSKSGI